MKSPFLRKKEVSLIMLKIIIGFAIFWLLYHLVEFIIW